MSYPRVEYHNQFSIDPLEGKDGISILNQGLEQLKDKHCWISSGTLLGLYRDKQLIPHDTDIDVNVLDSSEIKLEGFDLIRTIRFDGKPMQTAFIKDGIIFDIYYFYSGIKDGLAMNYNDCGVIEKPLEFITTLGTLEHNGINYPTPSNLDAFLEWRYGTDWRIPKKSKQEWSIDANHLKPYSA